MKLELKHSHRWPTRVADARKLQNHLRSFVSARNRLGKIRSIAGVDLGACKGSTKVRGAIAVLDFPDLNLREQHTLIRSPRFPYVPGYLSFREIPVALALLRKLAVAPDLIICDGQGYAHPRRFGLACHLGVLTDIPTIGAAKSRLIGEHDTPGIEKGSETDLVQGGECIGRVLRTRDGVKPLYVSIGHGVDLPTACDLVLRCCKKYRLPETTRAAHRLASG